MRDHDPDAPPLTLSDAFARAARQSLDKLREGEERIRKDGDLEGVHLMRTSCRRLRAAVKYLGDHLGRSERKALQAGLRDLMGALGPVRDLDVLRSAIDGVDALDPVEAGGLCEEIDGRLAEADALMQRTIDGKEYAHLVDRLERAICTESPGAALNLHGPSRIMDSLADVMRLKPADWEHAPEEALHDLRKGVKKLRYALEAFAPAYGRPVARQVDRCRGLQESLGALQDAAVFAGQLQGMKTFVAGQFIATMRTRADGHLKKLPELWAKTFPPKGIARLGGHLFRRALKGSAPAPKHPVSLSAAVGSSSVEVKHG